MENHWFCLKFDDFACLGPAFLMFSESVGLLTSFQMLRMHRDILLDIYEKVYFLFFPNSKIFPHVQTILGVFSLMYKVPRAYHVA